VPIPLLLSLTPISDHPKAAEVLTGSDPQSSTVPVRIPISFWSGALDSMGGGWVVLSQVHSLVLSKWTDGAAHFLTKS
jgi:hypothetical protein